MAVIETRFYNAGIDTTLATYGITKMAAGGASMAGSAARWVKNRFTGDRLKSMGRGIKEFAVGNPGKFWEEVRAGKALAPGSLVREGLKAPTILDKALFYGLPAYEVGTTLGDHAGDKANRVGATLGASALGMAAFKPLGMLGALAASSLGGAVGGGAGTAFGHATGIGNDIEGQRY